MAVFARFFGFSTSLTLLDSIIVELDLSRFFFFYNFFHVFFVRTVLILIFNIFRLISIYYDFFHLPFQIAATINMFIKINMLIWIER